MNLDLQAKGVSFGFMARKGYYRSEAGQREIEAICDLGANYVALIVTVMQDTYHSTKMYHDFAFSPSDGELVEAIRKFQSRGVKVMLKPMIECHDSIWRGMIRFPHKQMMIQGIEVDYWGEWFRNYTDCIAHYAQLAEDNKVELFCVGCELLGCEGQEEYWPGVIERVRSIYRGPITYNADQYRPGTPFIREWFSLLDVLGVSFYSGTPRLNPTPDEIAMDLQKNVELLENDVVKAIGRPLLFAECGARSVVGGTETPARYDNFGEYDGMAQANYLEGVVKAFEGKPWWKGLMWWKWDEQQNRPHYVREGGDAGFTMKGKPAEEAMRRWCKKK